VSARRKRTIDVIFTEVPRSFFQRSFASETLYYVSCAKQFTILFVSKLQTRTPRVSLRWLRAQVNRELIAVITEPETANARHFQQLCQEPQKEVPQKEAPQKNTA
jgi:hypothetical protein